MRVHPAHSLAPAAAILVGLAVAASSAAAAPKGDPLASQEQPQKIMRVERAVSAAGHLRQVKVMIPDTGLDLDHPDLASRLYSLPKPTRAPNQYPGQFPNVTIPAGVHGYDMIGNDCVPDNEVPDLDPDNPPGCSDHGTEVAGVLGAAWDNGVGGRGIAPNARFIALRTCWDGDQCYDHIQPVAMQWAADRGARVKAPNVICVSVSAPDDGLDCAAYGPKDVDVAVPTENSVTTLNGGGFGGTGCATSFASPTVAGLATILFGMDPKASGAAVKRAIIDGARKVHAWHGKSVSGGIADAARSVRLMKRRF